VAQQTDTGRPQYHLPELRDRQIVQATLPELLVVLDLMNIHRIVTVHRFRVQRSRLRTEKGLKGLDSLHPKEKTKTPPLAGE